MKTFDPKQSEKIERNKFLVLKKFVQTTVVLRINVTVDSNTHIFSTSPFEYNHLLYDNFFQPHVLEINNILNGNNIGARVSVSEVVIDKSSSAGTSWCRTDLILASEDQSIVIKFWDNKKDIFTPVHTGQLLTCFSVLTTRYNAQTQLNATDQTTIQIHTTPEQQKVLTVIAYDNKRSDNNVEILTETGGQYV